MKFRVIAFLLALLLLPACAAAQDLDEGGYVLLDIAAAAAVSPDGQLEGFQEGETVPESFAQRFLMCFGMSSLESAEARGNFLARYIAAPLPEIPAMDPSVSPTIAGMQVMSVDMDADGDAAMVIGQLYTIDEQQNLTYLDVRAVAELHRSAEADLGWKLYRFAIGQELLMESATEEYFAARTVEYYNAVQGFAIQYPAIFPAESVVEDAWGMSAALPGDTVSFFVRWEENAQGLTLEAFLDGKKKEIPTLQTNIDEITGCGQTFFVSEEGQVEVDFYFVTEGSIYHAYLAYPADAQDEYAPYVEYMMNSFTADELGLG